MTITLDIGGEGRHPGALNLNLSRHKTLGAERGVTIPNLIVARADRLPLADRSVQRLIVERTPLSREALAEIARVVAPQGTIELAHVPLPNADRHCAGACYAAGRCCATPAANRGPVGAGNTIHGACLAVTFATQARDRKLPNGLGKGRHRLRIGRGPPGRGPANAEDSTRRFAA